jgi:SGNH hydrolase-like domain, acetyltransferase AlgX
VTDLASDRPGRAKTALFGALTFVVTIAICLLMAEIVLRFLPVATGLWTLPVNAAHPVLRFTPNREFLFSRDWNFSVVNRGHINNDGFVNNQNYATNDPRPLLAVIGDSYVEAAMVPNDKTFYGRLAGRLKSNGRIYSFGGSGAPLSQYLVWAQYAAQTYRPSGMAIVVVGNDFDESLWSYNSRPGLHVYARGPDGALHLHRLDFQPSPFRFLVRHSALGRYLVFNLQALDSIRATIARWGLSSPAQAQTTEYAGNTAAVASPERLRDSDEAMTAFFDDLAKMVPLAPNRIAFLVDGARYEGEVAGVERSYFGVMRQRFMSEATRRGHEVVDLQPRFLQRSSDHRTRFDYPTDGHWNPTGHEVAAEALAASNLYRTLFADH